MERPKIVCLCGSTKFLQAFRDANFFETLKGNIVLSIGCDTKTDGGVQLTEEQKRNLDVLHKHKIDLADEVLILNVGDYIGESTRSELLHAQLQHKPIRFLEMHTPTTHELMERAAGKILPGKPGLAAAAIKGLPYCADHNERPGHGNCAVNQWKEDIQRHHDHFVRLERAGLLKEEDRKQWALAMDREEAGEVKPLKEEV